MKIPQEASCVDVKSQPRESKKFRIIVLWNYAYSCILHRELSNCNLQEVHDEGSSRNIEHDIIFLFNCSSIILYSSDWTSAIILTP